MSRFSHSISILLGALAIPGPARAQSACPAPVDPYDSGGPLDPAESAYDVRFYDLEVRVEPRDSTIAGRLDLHAVVVAPVSEVALDLDPLLAIERITATAGDRPLPYARCGGRVRVALGRTVQPGAALGLRVIYGGRPRVAPRPPWDGGFTWARTASGRPAWWRLLWPDTRGCCR